MKKKLFAAVVLSLVVLATYVPMQAKPSEYDAIVNHLKTKYRAKKVNIPFMWLARFAVSVSRPAGVKSFSVTVFRDLKFSYETLDREMQDAMRDSFGPEWIPAIRIRTRKGQQVYMYMREDGKNVRAALVTIDKDQAAIIRATFSPDRLTDFINNPKVLGVSLRDDTPKDPDPQKPEAPPATDPAKDGQ